MSNRIVIELCQEDRERLDKLTAALERKACDACTNQALAWAERVMRGEPIATIKDDEVDDVQKALAETLAKATDPAEAPKNATEEVETSTPTTNPAEEEKPTDEEPATAPTAPMVTRDELKAKVIKLCAKGLKEQARDVVRAYAQTVTAIPDDKVAECYEKLVALEG